MTDFSHYLNTTQRLTKEKKYDEAWGVANEGLLELMKVGNDSWYMMYYQIAIILSREKKWFQSLEKMGFMIHYLKTVGSTHEKFLLRLLKKYGKEDKLEQYIELALSKEPTAFGTALKRLLDM